MTDRYFQRYRWDDADALAQEIDAARDAVSQAQASGNERAEIEMSCRLAVALIAADLETEAASMLARLLPRARQLDDAAAVAWILHHLATAEQYCGNRDLAQAHFGDALRLTRMHGLRQIEHFVLHHRGRCHAEEGRIEDARRCFEQALAIREELREPRAERTREALAALETYRKL